jgi:bis(5'-nucleosyl)-tetraphosphatase (symmetrical)
LALFKEDVLMVHAGVLPQWTLADTLSLAKELQDILRGPDAHDFLMQMYGNEPAQWHGGLTGMDRWRCALNALTRLRFCSPSGHMEFETKESAAKAPYRLFAMVQKFLQRQTANVTIAFGHWSTLGGREALRCLGTRSRVAFGAVA